MINPRGRNECPEPRLAAALVDIDETTGKARSIERMLIPHEQQG